MRRFHNPRYAPESLERKLSPSGIVAIPVAAEIHVPNTQSGGPTRVTPRVVTKITLDTPPPTPPNNPAPPDGSGDPPSIPPIVPNGPGLPA